MPALSSLLGGMTYINNAVDATTVVSYIDTLFASNVVAHFPRACIINGGINDWNGNASYSSVRTAYLDMFKQCQNNGIIPIFLGAYPGNSGTGVQTVSTMTNHFALQQEMIGTIGKYGGFGVDMSTLLGNYTNAGPTGNLWNPIPGSYSDGVLHPNPTAQTNIAKYVASFFTNGVSANTRPASFTTLMTSEMVTGTNGFGIVFDYTNSPAAQMAANGSLIVNTNGVYWKSNSTFIRANF
jgi:hypothetical protein